jgi:hypothetical protein
MGLLQSRSREVGVRIESLGQLEPRQYVIAQKVEVVAKYAALPCVLAQGSVEPLHRVDLLAALRIHRKRGVGAAVEAAMRLAVTIATKSNSVPCMKSRFGQKAFPANVVCGDLFRRMAIDAAVRIARANEFAPQSKTPLMGLSIRDDPLELQKHFLGGHGVVDQWSPHVSTGPRRSRIIGSKRPRPRGTRKARIARASYRLALRRTDRPRPAR